MTETFDIGNIPPQLRESMLHGKGAADIGWGRDGDFNSCLRFLEEHGVPRKFWHGECAELHKEATGFWAGKGRHHSAEDMQVLVAAMGDYQPIMWRGPLAPIGKPTGDGRLFPKGTITQQTFPQPLGWQEKSTMGHDGAITVGVIEHAEEGMWNGEPHIVAHGYFLNPDIIPEVTKAVHQIEHGVAGPSVDLDSFAASLSTQENGKKLATVKEGRQRSATLVRIPAFADLRLQLEHPQGVDTAIVASGATFAVNPASWKGAPIAPRNALFDADDAVKRIQDWAAGDAEKMASAFLWINSENEPLLGREGYRLPWGDIVDGELHLIYHAAYAAAALLEGAHGGLPNIPDAEKNKLRDVLTEIYDRLSTHFDDPSLRPSWAPGGAAAAEQVEEFAGHYTEGKHPRDPRHDKHAGEWIDVPHHGPHGQILDKATGKMVYPDKKTGKLPAHHEEAKPKPRAKATVRKKAAAKEPAPKEHAHRTNPDTGKKIHPLTHEGVVAAHRESGGSSSNDQVSLVRMRAHLEGSHAQQTAFLKQLDRERKIQLEPEPNQKVLTPQMRAAGVPVGGQNTMLMSILKGPEASKPPAAKVTVRKATKEHKLTPAQEKYLKEGSGHPASRKVLEREGYLDSQGKLTEKGRGAAVEKAPKVIPVEGTSEQKAAWDSLPQEQQDALVKELAKNELARRAKVNIRKSAAHKVSPSQRSTLENLHKHGPLPEGNRRNGVHPASLKVLEREGYVGKKDNHWELTEKGRAQIGEKVPAVKGHSAQQPVAPKKNLSPRDIQKLAPVQWQYRGEGEGEQEPKLRAGLEGNPDRAKIEHAIKQYVWHFDPNTDQESSPQGKEASHLPEPTINERLRTGASLQAGDRAQMKYLDEAMNHSHLPEDVTVHRGVTYGNHMLPKDWEHRDLTGMQWTSPAYTSVSSDRDKAEAYVGDRADGGLLLNIKLPKGSSAISVMDPDETGEGLDDENEMILPRGGTFRVIKDHGDTGEYGVRTLDVEFVAPASKPKVTVRRAPKNRMSGEEHNAALNKITSTRDVEDYVKGMSRQEVIDTINARGGAGPIGSTTAQLREDLALRVKSRLIEKAFMEAPSHNATLPAGKLFPSAAKIA